MASYQNLRVDPGVLGTTPSFIEFGRKSLPPEGARNQRKTRCAARGLGFPPPGRQETRLEPGRRQATGGTGAKAAPRLPTLYIPYTSFFFSLVGSFGRKVGDEI